MHSLIQKSAANQLADTLENLSMHQPSGYHLGMSRRLADTSREIRHLCWVTSEEDRATLVASIYGVFRGLADNQMDDLAEALVRACDNLFTHLPAHDTTVTRAVYEMRVGIFSQGLKPLDTIH